MKIRFDNNNEIEEFLKTASFYEKPNHAYDIVEYHLDVRQGWLAELLIVEFSMTKGIWWSKRLLNLKQEELLLDFLEKHYPEVFL